MSPAPARRPSRLRKAALQLGAALALLVAAELLLRAAGVQPTARTEDPYVGFAGSQPLYVADGEDRVTAPNKLDKFNLQRFATDKPDGTFRIFTLGGSTTYGRPYDDRTSFSAWLRELLPRVDPSRAWEVINAGGISYASYRVAAVMEELLAYEPDLFIVYTGHNEFLEQRTYSGLVQTPEALLEVGSALSRTSLYTAARGLLRRVRGQAATGTGEGRFELTDDVTTRLDGSFGPSDFQRDDAGAAAIVEHFRLNLHRMVTMARRAGVALILVTPASSLADCTPFKSEFSDELPAADREAVAGLLEQAATARDRDGDLGRAVELLAEAVAVDPRHAASQYRLGEALRAQGRAAEARAALTAARDEDVCPLRAISPLVDAVREVAARRDVPLVDWQALVAARAPVPGVPGAESFLDHVHLTVDAHRALALELLETMTAAGLVQPGPGSPSLAVAEVEGLMEARVDREMQGLALKNLAKVLGWAGKQDEARRLALQSQQLLGSGDAETHFLLGTQATADGRFDQAAGHYREAVGLDPAYGEAWLNLGQSLLELGRVDEARQAADRAVTLMPDHAPAHELVGLVHTAAGRPEQAVAALQRAIDLRPDNARARNNLGLAWLRLDRRDEARAAFEGAVEADPGYARGHYNLGLLQLAAGDQEAGVASLRLTLRLDPTHERARRRLADMGLQP